MSSLRQSNAYPGASGGTRFSRDMKRSSKQHQNSKMVSDTVCPTQATQNLKHQGVLKAKSYINKAYGGVPCELKQNPSNGTLAQPKASANCHQLAVFARATKDDELVKYMSTLPSYLQRVERTENIQDKALNMGVLDWGRLENWKSNQKGIPVGVGNNALLPSSNLSTKMTTRSLIFHSPPQNDTLTSESKLRPSPSCRNISSHNDGISRNDKSSFQGSGRFQDVDNALRSHFDGQKRAACSYKSLDRSRSETVYEKGEKRELDRKISSKVDYRSSNSNYNRMPVGPKESVRSCDRKAKQRIECMQGADIKRKAFKQKSLPSMGASSSESGNNDISLSKEEKKNVDNRMKKKIELQKPVIDLPQNKVDGSKNIVVLVPAKKFQSSPLRQARKSMDDNVTSATQNSLSDGFSDEEVSSSELHYEIPHSCPLPSRVEINTEQREMAPDPINTCDVGLPSDAINGAMSSSENLLKTSTKMDQETAELAATRGRHPSPNRRFSFSLGQMTRSFSFKENSAIPQLSSTHVSVKSGPVLSKAYSALNNSNGEKASGHNRARSSPLRRILDPLLRSRGSTLTTSAGTDHSSRGSLDSDSYEPINATESLQNENFELSSTQAQLLVTSNGFPLFRFAINSKNIIVAAPMKNLTLTGKNDQDCNYVLYAIDEIKRKSGSWIHQVGKEKSCGFVYNVVGHMKVNGSFMDLSRKNSSNQYMVKESSLFGAERRQTGQVSAELTPNTELAAVVVKKPGGNLSGYDKLGNDKETNLAETDFSWCVPDNECSSSCTVILPGGIHSLPGTVVPSSLIQRWRSGGSCDCGGWDVGCKLRILSNENQHQKLQRASGACLMSDQFELFVQGEPHQDTPIFSMAPMEKGKYSVEFSSSISPLQAFFICVSVISCQRLSDISEVSHLYDEKVLHAYEKVNGGVKNVCTNVVGNAPIQYTPCPPVSPVGRV